MTIENKSVPVKSILPHVRYSDIPAAIDWLGRTFGFREHYRHGDPVSGAQLHLGDAWIMIQRSAPGTGSPQAVGYGTQSLTVFVEDIAEHFAHTRTSGAKIVEDLHETVYGELQYGVEDLEGHRWLFSQHARDVDPREWGATVADDVRLNEPHRPRPSFCYLQIPAKDVSQSMAFYETVFSWEVRNRDSERPSFDDASGNISGAWVTTREVNREPGLLPYIWVDSLEASLSAMTTHGGEIVEAPHPTHPGSNSRIAIFRDPAGNVLGLYQENLEP